MLGVLGGPCGTEMGGLKVPLDNKPATRGLRLEGCARLGGFWAAGTVSELEERSPPLGGWADLFGDIRVPGITVGLQRA